MGTTPRARALALLVAAAILRTADLDAAPPGLNFDAAYIGYDAYSVLLTGRDSHGERCPLFFRSWGDYKSPVSVYSAVPLVMLLGPRADAVRLTAAVFGVLAVASTYALLSLLASEWTALAASLLLALAPVHVHFSRMAPEMVVLPLLSTSALYHLVLGLRRPRHLVYAAVPAALMLYAYPVGKVFGPLLLAAAAWPHRRRLARSRAAGASLALLLLLALPLAWALCTAPETVDARFGQVSVFSPAAREALLRDRPGLASLPPIVIPLAAAARNYATYLLSGFLYRRSSLDLIAFPPFLPPLPPIEGLLALLGLASVAAGRRSSGTSRLLLAWLLLAPLAASFTEVYTPSPKRVVVALPLLQLLAARGLAVLSRRRWALALLGLAVALSSLGALASYLGDYGCDPGSLYVWRAGLGEALEEARAAARPGEPVVLSRDVPEGELYAAFLAAVDPAAFQRSRLDGSGLDASGPPPPGPAVVVATLRDEELAGSPAIPLLAPGERSERPDAPSEVPNVLWGRRLAPLGRVERCGVTMFSIYRAEQA